MDTAATQPAAPSSASNARPKKEVKLDPEVEKLCQKMEIDPECARRLDEQIKQRQDTRTSDLAKLWDFLEDVGDATWLLNRKIDEMISGEFVGDTLEDREVEALALNFSLTKAAQNRLNEMVSCRETKKGQDLVRMESILDLVDKPSEIAIQMVDRLMEKFSKDKNVMLPDFAEAQDVIRKFGLTAAAKKTLVDIVLKRSDDSSRILGQLEDYFEQLGPSGNASKALQDLSGRLLAGFFVPDEPPKRRERQERSRSRDRGRDRRSRDRSRDRGGQSSRSRR